MYDDLLENIQITVVDNNDIEEKELLLN